MFKSSLTRKHNKKKNILLKIFIFSVLVMSVITLYVKNSISSVSNENGVNKNIIVPEGSGTGDIAKILKENELIKNETIFKIYSRIEGRDSKYKAGEYELNSGMNQEKIMNELEKGGKLKNLFKITIPEGFELSQIAERLETMGLTDKESFIDTASDVDKFKEEYDFLKDLPEGATLEGYLYPETYEVFKDATEEDIIKKMLDGFKNVYNTEIQEKGKELGMGTNKIVTLASIIEREAVIEEERYIMSGVFHNRLNIDMPLQSCATVQYALGERKAVLSNKDVQIDSIYNTYLNSGLPPYPISSPGIESIKAAVNPSEVEYLFFVRTGEDGSHTFTKSYNEHLKANNRE